MPATNVFAIAVALLFVGLPAVAAAESEQSAGVVTTINGDATLIRAVAAARPVSLQLRDEIHLRDRIHTQPRSLVRVLLGGKALLTVRELSVLTITEDAGRVTVDLQSGPIGVAVVKGRMRPGEVIEVRSPNATAAVRGTVFVVDVDPVPAGGSAGPVTTRVHLFQGALDVSAHLDPAQPAVQLAQMQSLVVTGNVPGPVRALSRSEVAGLTSDLKPKQLRAPEASDEFTRGLLAREQRRAIQLATALLPSTGAGPVLPGGLGAPVAGVTGTVSNLTQTTTETLDHLMDTLGLSETVVGGLVQDVGKTLNGTVGGLTAGLGAALGGAALSLPIGAGVPALPSLPLGSGLPTGGGLPIVGGGLPTGGGLPIGGGLPTGGGLPIGGGLPTGAGLPIVGGGLPIIGGGLPALGGGGGLPIIGGGAPAGGGGAPLGLPLPSLPLGALGGK
jgi:hypothetical protein